MAFIAAHKDRADGGLRWGVEPICQVLREQGVQVAPSTYYEARTRRPSARARREELLKAVIVAEWDKRQVLGARKLWLRLRRDGHDVARCTVERLMGELGIAGVRRGKKPRTTIPNTAAARPGDLVDRRFAAHAPNTLWVADFTYVPTWSGMVYVAFVFDVHSRRILGWRADTSMRTDLVLDCLDPAHRRRHGPGRTGPPHRRRQSVHLDRVHRPAPRGQHRRLGRVGRRRLRHALAEYQIGLYKTELIHLHSPWRGRDHVEAATLEWVHWLLGASTAWVFWPRGDQATYLVGFHRSRLRQPGLPSRRPQSESCLQPRYGGAHNLSYVNPCVDAACSPAVCSRVLCRSSTLTSSPATPASWRWPSVAGPTGVRGGRTPARQSPGTKDP